MRCLMQCQLEFAADSIQDAAAASLYLTAKPSDHPLGPRKVLTVFNYLQHNEASYHDIATSDGKLSSEWYLCDADYEAARTHLYDTEARILKVLGFEIRVALPYRLCINYLQVLDVATLPSGPSVAKRAVQHLNTALLSPQLLYLTHQPTALAAAAIYLSAREVGTVLSDAEWWEVFDVDREELGFLVVALQSTVSFAREEVKKWSERKVPTTVQATRQELARVNALSTFNAD